MVFAPRRDNVIKLQALLLCKQQKPVPTITGQSPASNNTLENLLGHL